MINDCNNTKAGTDAIDQLCANYSVAWQTCRQPMVIFYAILNIAGVNTSILTHCNEDVENLGGHLHSHTFLVMFILYENCEKLYWNQEASHSRRTFRNTLQLEKQDVRHVQEQQTGKQKLCNKCSIFVQVIQNLFVKILFKCNKCHALQCK